MAINFPSNSTPYTGNSQAGESPETTLPTGTGKVRPGEIAPQDALTLHRATSKGSAHIDGEGFSQRFFGAGGQVPLEPPPPPPSVMSVQKSRESLVAKFLPLLPDTDRNGNRIENPISPPPNGGGRDDGGAPPPRHRDVSLDAVLHLLLNSSVQQFQEAQLEAREDTQEKMADMDTAAADIKAAAKQRLTGAIAAGSGAIVAGTLSIAGAGINLKGGMVANKALDAMEVGEQGLNVNSRPLAFQSATYAYSGAAQVVQGSGQGLQGGMGILQAEDEESGAEDDAAKAEADKAVADDDALHDTAASQRQEYLSVMQDFLDKEKGLEQSEDQTMMTLARNV